MRVPGLEGYMKRVEEFRPKRIQKRRNTGKDGNRKGGFRIMTKGMRNRRDAGHWTGGKEK